MPGNLANSLTAVSNRADENCMHKFTILYLLHYPNSISHSASFLWGRRSPAACVSRNLPNPRRHSDSYHTICAGQIPRDRKVCYYTGMIYQWDKKPGSYRSEGSAAQDAD